MQQIPIVLIPGLNCTAEIFSPQIPAIWPFGPVTVASTMIGDSMAAMAAEILAAAPPQFALGGISMGGYLCFEIFRQARDRVLRLALMDTSARPDTAEQTTGRTAKIGRAAAGEYEAVVAEQFPQVVHPSHVGSGTLRAAHVGMAAAVGAAAYARQQRAIIGRPDSRGMLASITVPTVVIVGEADQVTPPDLAREMADGIPGARLVVLPQSGHLSTIEQPGRVNEELRDWLSQG